MWAVSIGREYKRRERGWADAPARRLPKKLDLASFLEITACAIWCLLAPGLLQDELIAGQGGSHSSAVFDCDGDQRTES